MAGSKERDQQFSEVERNLPPDLALLLGAIRAEFDAKLSESSSRLLLRLTLMGIPLGAVGGFVAELVRPGTAHQAIVLVFGWM